MGWTIEKQYQRKSAEDIREFFKQEFSSYEILDSSVHSGEFYAAMRNRSGGPVFCLICILKNTGSEFGYKDMSEDMHPFYYNCPVRIIKQLGTAYNEDAKAWRLKCMEKQGININQSQLF